MLRIIARGSRQLDFVVERFLSPIAAQQIERFVDRDAVDPAEKLVVRIIFVQPLCHPKENDLRDVACVLGLAQYPEGCVVNRPLVADHKRGEGLTVAGPPALHQRLIGVVVHNYTRPVEKLAPNDYRAGSISKSWSNPE